METAIQPGTVIKGEVFPEPIRVVLVQPIGAAVKIGGQGLHSKQYHERLLTQEQALSLEVIPVEARFDADAQRFRLGIEAARLGLAYEYDPYFSLSIARIDPLPHQLEAVYHYMLPLPRIRFLLADDAGAGKTIMAGLLLKELKLRGLVSRTLIVTPANLHVPMAEGNAGSVPRAFRNHSWCGFEIRLWSQPMARQTPGDYFNRLGQAGGGTG
jgi:hypothetical protein